MTLGRSTFSNWLLNLYPSQKNGFISPLHNTQAESITFVCDLMGRAIILNFIFISNPWTRLFWEFKGTSKVRSFSSCHTHFFDRTNFPKPICQDSSFFCSSFLCTWTNYGCLQTFELHPSSSFYYLSYEVWLIPLFFFHTLLATCGYQDYLLLNRLSLQ